jgi:hypothetical protein
MSTAEYQRAWRAKHGAGTGKPGRPVTQPCGTVAAYKRHQRHRELPCEACRSAWSDWQRAYHQRVAGSTTDGGGNGPSGESQADVDGG